MATPQETPDDAVEAGNPIARNNETIGSVASLVVLALSIGAGAGLMLGTGTRGIAAIGTVILVASGTFCLVMLAVSGLLRAVVPDEQWDAEDAAWRRSMRLGATDADEATRQAAVRRKVALGGTAALLLGLAISVLPAMA